MQGVATLEGAKFLHFDPFPVIHLVFGRDVVTPLAVLTLQGDMHTLFILRHGASSFPSSLFLPVFDSPVE